MTPKLKYNDAMVQSPGSNARRSIIGMLLLSIGLLLTGLQPAMGQVFQVVPGKNNSVAGSGTEDVVNVLTNPATPGLTITFTVAGTYQFKVITDASGVAYFHFAYPTPGTYPVTIQYGSLSLGTVDFNFITQPGSPSPSHSYILVTKQTSPADGVTQDVVVARIFDNNGNPVNSGVEVHFQLPPGSGLIVPTMTTNGTPPPVGKAFTVGNDATAYFTSTTPGTANVAAQLDDGTGNWVTLTNISGAVYSQPIYFTALPPSASNSYIVGITTTTAADGSSQDEVDAVIKNSLGNPVADGTAVTFSIQSGTANMTTTGVVSGGVVKAYFTSTAVGSVQVQAQVNINGIPTYLDDKNAPANNYTTVQFTIPPPVTASSHIAGVTVSAAADGASQDEVDATVNNALGPVADGTIVTFTIKSGTATINTTGVTQGGVAKAYFTSTVVGAVQVQAQVSINGTPTYLTDQNAPANNYTTIQFTTPPAVVANSHIAGITTSTAADGTSRDEVDAIVNNATGPVADGTPVVFTIKTGTATIITTGTTVNGVAVAYFTSTVVGSVQVQAQITVGGTSSYLTDVNAPANNYTTIQFVAGPPVSGNPGGGGGGGGGNPGGGGGNPGGGGGGGNPGGGGGGGNPGGGGGNPGGGGGNPGGGGSGTGNNNGLTNLFVPYGYNERIADGKQQDSLVAYITDAGGNPISGLTVTFVFHTTPETGTIASGAQFVGSTQFTTDKGFARMAVTSTQPGTVFVDAFYTDPTTNTQVKIYVSDNNGLSYETLTFLAAPDVTNPLTSLTTIVFEALADGKQQTEVKAHVVDLNGNIMPNQAVYFAIDSGSGTIVTPQPAYTDANGDAYIYITGATPGDVLLTATVGNKKVVFGSPARVRFAPINFYVPRVFTPNNDGTNDMLRPILVGIAQFHYFNVYNRWGNLVFTTQDPNQGWDGTFKGVPQPVETYLWIGEGIDVNGKKIVQRGMVSLAR